MLNDIIVYLRFKHQQLIYNVLNLKFYLTKVNTKIKNRIMPLAGCRVKVLSSGTMYSVYRFSYLSIIPDSKNNVLIWILNLQSGGTALSTSQPSAQISVPVSNSVDLL